MGAPSSLRGATVCRPGLRQFSPSQRGRPDALSAVCRGATGGACGYDELELELDDFDLIYAYPWPGEEDWLYELVRRHARPGALLLTYDVSEGFRLARDGEPAGVLDLST